MYMDITSSDTILELLGMSIFSILFFNVQLPLILYSLLKTTLWIGLATNVDKLYNGELMKDVIGLPGQPFWCSLRKI